MWILVNSQLTGLRNYGQGFTLTTLAIMAVVIILAMTINRSMVIQLGETDEQLSKTQETRGA